MSVSLKIPHKTRMLLLSRMSTVVLGDRPFCAAGRCVWNNLPTDLGHPDLSYLFYGFRRSQWKFHLGSGTASQC